MRTMTKRIPIAAVATAATASVVLLAAAALHASGSGPAPQENRPQTATQAESQAAKPYDRGMDLAHDEKFAEARAIFEQLAVEDPDNAEVLNMLAYTQRKTGDLDVAIENYNRALKLKPKFPQAREYLGEAYLQAALREAKTLEGYGGSGRDELRKLADAFQEAASHLDGSGTKGGSKSAGGW